jgi:hypothetical protein
MRVLLILLLSIWISAPASGQSAADRGAVQSVIEQQLQAFQRDDAATAYSFAAPGIKQMFPTEDIFMQMVQKGYPQVYRPRSHQFLDLVEKGGQLEQTVEIVDADGTFWTALYTLQKQPDGSWKITSCLILKKPGAVA